MLEVSADFIKAACIQVTTFYSIAQFILMLKSDSQTGVEGREPNIQGREETEEEERAGRKGKGITVS